MRPFVKLSAVLPIGLVLLGAAVAESVEVSVPLTIVRNEARGSFELPGGIGADVTITFEDVVGLHPKSINLFVNVIDPLDPDLLDLLGPLVPSLPSSPGGLLGGGVVNLVRQVTIPVSFPVILRIEASESSQLSFEGIASVSIHTHNLELDRLIPFALYKSHDGQPFRDVMTTEGRGSYRAGGGGGDFSEFLIVIDRRPIDTVIQGKFAALDAVIAEHASVMPPAIADSLEAQAAAIRSLYDTGALRQALVQLRAFSRYVSQHSGEEIPNVWRANCGSVNAAGRLRGAADTLRFSIDRKLGQ